LAVILEIVDVAAEPSAAKGATHFDSSDGSFVTCHVIVAKSPLEDADEPDTDDVEDGEDEDDDRDEAELSLAL
jgi:hypothetical protein